MKKGCHSGCGVLYGVARGCVVVCGDEAVVEAYGTGVVGEGDE